MTKRLPKKLNKEPLVDAIFDIRFDSSFAASEVFPGFLFSKLDGKKELKSTSISQIPKAIREADPKLKFSPIIRLDWDKFFINIGAHNISVGCKLPYPGWEDFKHVIVKLLDYLKETQIVKSVQRYSLKYIDLIPRGDLIGGISCLNVDVVIAGTALEEKTFRCTVEISDNKFVHLVQLISSATVNLPDGPTLEGVVTDIDTVLLLNDPSLEQILSDDISNNLDKIHDANKKMFFACLKPETIKTLGPIYG